MARSRFRTKYGRIRHHAMRTRRLRRHHGFLTKYHRPVTGGKIRRKHVTMPHVVVKHSAHAGHLIAGKAKAQAAVRRATPKTGPKLSHTKVAGRRKVGPAHHAGVHAVGAKRTMSPAARLKLSRALTGKHHPHRGHTLSTATRAKIAAALSKRLKGRPHPHKGHAMSNTARAKISKALKGKPHPHRSTRRKKR